MRPDDDEVHCGPPNHYFGDHGLLFPVALYMLWSSIRQCRPKYFTSCGTVVRRTSKSPNSTYNNSCTTNPQQIEVMYTVSQKKGPLCFHP